MKSFATVVMVLFAVLLLAAPAGAQDPYGEVLPRDVERSGEVTVAPDGEAPGEVARAQPGALPRTGFGLTVGTLALATVLLAGGVGAVLVARRRGRSAG